MAARIRRSVWSLPEGDPAFVWYRRAVAELLRRPVSDPSKLALHGGGARRTRGHTRAVWRAERSGTSASTKAGSSCPGIAATSPPSKQSSPRPLLRAWRPGGLGAALLELQRGPRQKSERAADAAGFLQPHITRRQPQCAVVDGAANVSNGDFNLNSSVVSLAALQFRNFAKFRSGASVRLRRPGHRVQSGRRRQWRH